MANSYVHREVYRVRHEWRVPGATYSGWGAAIAEVHRAITAAERRYLEVTGREPNSDDWLRVWAGDDDIVLFFEQEVKEQ